MKTEQKKKIKLKVKTKPTSEDLARKPLQAAPTKPAPVVFDVNWKHGTIADTPRPAVVVPESPKPVYVDLFPWQFEKTRKGIILRGDWNGLVTKIQAACNKELEAENNELQHQIKKLLDERDAVLAKYKEMSEFVAKFNREFTATYK